MSDLVSNLSNLAIESLPELGAAAGSMIAPGIGTELGSVAGQITQNLLSESVTGSGSLDQGAPAPTSEVREVTSFSGEETSQTVDIDPRVEYSPVQDISSLRQFFARPLKIGSWHIGGSATKPYWWPQAYFTSPQVAEKIKSFSGARFTMCVRVVSNATPFSNYAGLLFFMPSDFYSTGLQSSTTSQGQVCLGGDDVDSLVAGFHCPHVIHDISQTTSTEFRVKWWSQLRFFDTGTLLGLSSTNYSAYDLTGRFFLQNISRSLDSSSQVADGQVTVYMWLEDLDLYYPTSFDSIHASSRSKTVYRAQPQLPDACGPEHHSHHPKSVIVSRNDLIDDVAHPPGITKPMALTETQVEVHGHSHDSMLDYFKTPSFLGYDVLSQNTDKAGKIFVRPYTSFRLTRSQTPAIYAIAPPTKLAVATDLYQFWKGSITFKFTFVASKFHTARVQFGFVPHVAADLSETELLESEELWQNIESTVMDLRDTHEIEVNCPYRLSTHIAYRTDVSGTLIWRTLNPLRAQAGASTSILFFAEIAGGPDFTVARWNPTPDGICWFGKTISKSFTQPSLERSVEILPTACGPEVGGASLEHVPDVVNDGPLTFSQALAAPRRTKTPVTHQVQHMFIGADNDVLVSGPTIPRPQQDRDVDAVLHDVSSHTKIRSLFYGLRSELYHRNLTGETPFNVNYGTESVPSHVCFPYTGNTLYHGLGSVILNDTTTPFGLYSMKVASAPGARLFHPWGTPIIDFLTPPRTISLDAVTSRASGLTTSDTKVGCV